MTPFELRNTVETAPRSHLHSHLASFSRCSDAARRTRLSQFPLMGSGHVGGISYVRKPNRREAYGFTPCRTSAPSASGRHDSTGVPPTHTTRNEHITTVQDAHWAPQHNHLHLLPQQTSRQPKAVLVCAIRSTHDPLPLAASRRIASHGADAPAHLSVSCTRPARRTQYNTLSRARTGNYPQPRTIKIFENHKLRYVDDIRTVVKCVHGRWRRTCFTYKSIRSEVHTYQERKDDDTLN